LSGEVVWRKEIPTYESYNSLGAATSPTVYKDRLYILDDNPTAPSLSALDARTGAEIWRTKREVYRGGASWAIPYIWENELRTEIVTSASDRVRSYDLDGRLLWELKGMT